MKLKERQAVRPESQGSEVRAGTVVGRPFLFPAVQRMMIQVVQELSSESFLLYRKQPWRGLRVNVGIRLRRGTTSVFSGKGTTALVLLYRKEVSKPVW